MHVTEGVPQQDEAEVKRGKMRPRLVQVEDLVAEVVRQLTPPPPAPGQTFGGACAAWLAQASKRLEDTRNEKRHVELLQSLWGFRESELTPKRVRAHLDSLLRPTGPLGASTVNMVRAKGRKIIHEAQLNEEWGGLNPFVLVPRYKAWRPEHHRITLEEVRRVLPHLERPVWRQAMVALLLGLRPGEVKALRREDVDMAKGTLTVRRSNHRNRTKTGRPRVLPILSQLREALQEALEASPSELVFPSEDGGRQRADRQWSRTLRKAYTAASLHAPTVRWYDLRHACANLHVEAGCSHQVVRHVLGHAGKDTTEAHYLHFTHEFVRAELGKLRLFP